VNDDLALSISEVFYSIQGESSRAGYPCVFIRTAGCNLRCRYCDAPYTYEEAGKQIKISALLDKVAEHPRALVEITGGEPLIHKEVYPLMVELLKQHRTVLVETNGSVSLEEVPDGVNVIMDLKCPDSAMHSCMDLDNLDLLTPNDEVKFVICSRRDYEWAVGMLNQYEIIEKVKNVLFSPVRHLLQPAILAQWMLDDGLPVRLQLQLHTFIWPDKKRGA